PDSQLRTAEFFKKQAAERKAMFETALRQANPSVTTVFLSIVPEVFCPSLVRVGSVADGGKWMCNPWAMPKDSVVFSLGSNGDISFESDLQKATGNAASIVTVDMTPASDRTLKGLDKIGAKFVHAMIAPQTNLTSKPSHYTVADLMRSMGHNQIEILKMDIEGERATITSQSISINELQIMVEIHAIKGTQSC
ncbi:hypothetical protein PMAYCL1PPCAC_15838, partial [Pristionchus mayeri]